MTLRRTALLVLPTLALSVTGAQAEAASYHWKSLTSINNGTVQACKVPTTATGPWKVRFRVNANRATSKVQGLAQPWKGTKQLNAGWTSAYIRPGNVSNIGVVKLPRGTAYSLSVGINIGQAGNGGSFKASTIPHC